MIGRRRPIGNNNGLGIALPIMVAEAFLTRRNLHMSNKVEEKLSISESDKGDGIILIPVPIRINCRHSCHRCREVEVYTKKRGTIIIP